MAELTPLARTRRQILRGGRRSSRNDRRSTGSDGKALAALALLEPRVPALLIPSYSDLLKQKTMQKLFSQSSQFVDMEDLTISSSRTPHNSGNITAESDAEAVDDFLKSLQRGQSQENSDKSCDDNFVKRSLTVKSSPPGYGFYLQGGAPVFVSQVHQGSAAESAGLRRGDFIVKINGHPIIAKTHSYVVDIVRYSAGAPITFTVLSPSPQSDSFTDCELRLFWAQLHLLNFPGSNSTLYSGSNSQSPTPSPIQSPTHDSRSLHTPTPPPIRPRTSSLGNTTDAVKRSQGRSQTFSAGSQQASDASRESPQLSGSEDADHRRNTSVESELDKKRRLLRKGTMNIFAASPKQNKDKSPETSSTPTQHVLSDSPRSASHVVYSVENQQEIVRLEQNSHEIATPVGGQRIMQSPLASGVSSNTPQRSSSESSNSTSQNASSTPHASGKNTPISNGRTTPAKTPPSSDAALRAIKSTLDIALPAHPNRRLSTNSAILSATESVSSPQDIPLDAPRPPRRSSSYKRLNEIISEQEGSRSSSPQMTKSPFEEKPAWQWTTNDVQDWLVRNAFHQSAKKMTELEGLQLLSLRRKEMFELGLRDEAVMERLFNAVSDLRRGLSLPPASFHSPSTPRRLSPSLLKAAHGGQMKFESPTTPTRGHIVQPVREWRMADVDVWLRQFGDINHTLCSGVFTDHAVNGRTLLRLTDEKLISMGVSAKPLRQDILTEVQMLRMKQEELELRKLLMERRGPQPVN